MDNSESQSKEEPVYCMFLDLETGGFSPTSNAICEIAFIVFDVKTYEIVSKSCLKIKPYFRDLHNEIYASYKDDALKVNGHNVKDLEKNGMLLIHVLAVLEKVIGQFNIKFFGGHNIESFDIKFLKNVYRLYLEKDFEYQALVCTLKLSRIRLNLKSNKLEDLCTHLQIPATNYHTAMADTEASFEVLKKLRPIIQR